jgi:UDPglucose 6-dehydrogenase
MASDCGGDKVKPKIGVVGLGLGYGLSMYLASLGHDVVGIDIDSRAYRRPRVDERTERWLDSVDWKGKSTPKFSTDFRRLRDSDYIAVFVSTPLVEGRLDIRNVLASLTESTKWNSRATYLIVSTLPIGAMKTIRGHFDVRVFYTPPMVRKDDFLNTFRHPPSNWQLIGHNGIDDCEDVCELFRQWQSQVPQFVVHEDTAIAAKLCTNLMLSTKIVMANAIESWIGAYAKQVCEIVSSDPRIGKGYFAPGLPASGPCFPRDLTELEAVSEGPIKRIIQTLNEANHTNELV